MRFHKLTLTNINSLYGTHELDFDAVAGQDGMFLIHGVTGAGKSTVLDGISLALFGLTSRLRSTSAKTLDGSAEGAAEDAVMGVLSRGCGRCQVVLELSLLQDFGDRTFYRASWGVYRSREKADGPFQNVTRVLEERVDGEWKTIVDSDKVGQYTPAFAKMLRGLTFDDFERTTLLAQFKFREFLDSDEARRAAILERMTDGRRFREIGSRAATQRKAAAEGVRDLKVALGTVTVWTAAQRTEKEAALVAACFDTALLREAHSRAAVCHRHVAQSIVLEDTQRRALGARELLKTERTSCETLFAALASDERVRGAREALVVFREACAVGKKAEDSVKLAEADADAASQREGAARALGDEALAALTRAIASREAKLPEVLAAEDAWREASIAERDGADAEEKANGREAAKAAALAACGDAKAALDDSQEAIAKVDDKLGKIPGASELAAAVPKVEALAKAWKDAAKKVQRAGELVAKKGPELHAHEATRQPLADALSGAQQREADARAEEHAANEALARGAGDVPAEDAIRAQEAVIDESIKRVKLLDAIRNALGEIGVDDADARKAQAQVLQGRDALARAQIAHVAAQAASASREADLATRRELVQALDELLGVLAHRGALKADEPCPVCGGEEHPYRKNPHLAPNVEEKKAQRDAARAACVRAEAALRAAVKDMNRALGEEATTRTAVKKDEDTLAAIEVRRAGHVCNLQPLWGAAELGPCASVDDVRAAIGVEEGRGAEAKARMNAVRLAVTRGTSASLAHSEARGKRQGAEAEVRAHGVACEAAMESLRHAEAALREEQAAAARAEAELREVLVPLHASEADAMAGAKLVTSRAAEVVALRNARDGHETERQRAEVAHAAARAKAEESERLATETRDMASEKAGVARDARARAGSLLGGTEPSRVRQLLDGEVNAAREAEANARGTAGKMAVYSAEARSRADERRTQRGNVRDTEAAAREALENEARAANVSGEAEIDALSLDASMRIDAITRRSDLEDREKAAVVRVDEADKALLEHEARVPDGAPLDVAGEGASDRATRLADLARVELEAGLAADAAVRIEGSLSQEIEADAATRDVASKHADALASAEDDLAKWEVIHDLIGVGEGERFTKLVQVLNLQRVLDRANENLERFMPRYALMQVTHKTDGPKLDFRVRDREHQDTTRPIKSLSGGESFIVSLALALGLAAMRTGRLRIETLLIDEGFGALDLRTLETAMCALAALQNALGVRIGLISHVEYLKEVIPAQFFVETLGGGRSKVTSPAVPILAPQTPA